MTRVRRLVATTSVVLAIAATNAQATTPAPAHPVMTRHQLTNWAWNLLAMDARQEARLDHQADEISALADRVHELELQHEALR